MKKLMIAIAAGLLCGASPAAQKPMHPALEKLDLDGDLVLFLNTSTIEEAVLDYINTLATLIQDSANQTTPGQNPQAMVDGVEKIKAAIEWSGLLSLESYAMSMAPTDGTLNRIISIAQHAEADASKPLWRLVASEPHALRGIGYVPANAVYAANTTASLGEAWKVVNEAMAKFSGPESAAAFNQQIAMAEMMLGTNIAAITGSLENELLLSIQLAEDKQVTIPQGTNTMSFPEPSLLVGLQTKEPLLRDLLLQKLVMFQMPAVESTHGDYTLHTINLPLPSPFPLAPTLVMTEDYLLIGSTREVVTEALDSQANQSGLVSAPLYQKLLADAPKETSGIEFLSPRFMQVYLAVMKQVMTSSQNPEELMMMDLMFGAYKDIYSGGYILKTPTSLLSVGYADYGGAKPVEMAASSYIGMLAAIGIPSFQKARNNSQDKVCGNNLRILEAAKQQWAIENGKADDEPVAEMDITEYIKGGFPAMKCPKGGTYTINSVGTAAECSVHGK